MTFPTESSIAFIVRVWREPREIQGAAPEWRGVIEHAASGQKRYFRDIETMEAFMLPYLEQLGITPSLSWRIRKWLQARKPRT